MLDHQKIANVTKTIFFQLYVKKESLTSIYGSALKVCHNAQWNLVYTDSSHLSNISHHYFWLHAKGQIWPSQVLKA